MGPVNPVSTTSQKHSAQSTVVTIVNLLVHALLVLGLLSFTFGVANYARQTDLPVHYKIIKWAGPMIWIAVAYLSIPLVLWCITLCKGDESRYTWLVTSGWTSLVMTGGSTCLVSIWAICVGNKCCCERREAQPEVYTSQKRVHPRIRV